MKRRIRNLLLFSMFGFLLVLSQISPTLAISFPINDDANDVKHIIGGQDVGEGAMPEIDILSLEMNPTQLTLTLGGVPVLDSDHIYQIIILWDIENITETINPTGTITLNANSTICNAGALQDPVANGVLTRLRDSNDNLVFQQNSSQSAVLTGETIIWPVDLSYVQDPNNPEMVVIWTMVDITTNEHWIDVSDIYWIFTLPTGTTTKASGMSIYATIIGLSMVVVSWVIYRKKKK